ncbi:hypothetical protein [Paenibacillus donghaensis]|uniref:Uncharacterized protein n=1 Tax=Paenibacillus donghaensis TaxID=414771 RepID=A0A2Z2KLC0_9BACL|nr:hypothetical protein [Paenibacillus donghaensis]ASA21842.1 hypothetical protein B9T62_14290 [Paenibacillus donghaensis]
MIDLVKTNSPVLQFISNFVPDNDFSSFSPELPEITLYYAAVATDRLSGKGNVIYDEYIFQTEQEATDSGLEYGIATWADINMFSDCGYTYSDVIVCTPQGRFVFHEIYMNEEEREWDTPSKCVYRAHGAPAVFSERVEEYLDLNYNDGARLLNLSCDNRNGQAVYTATLSSVTDGTFSINNLGEFLHH